MGYETEFLGSLQLTFPVAPQPSEEFIKEAERLGIEWKNTSLNNAKVVFENYWKYLTDLEYTLPSVAKYSSSSNILEFSAMGKFYDFDDWLVEFIDWLDAHDIKATGEITKEGEDRNDNWKIIVEDNSVEYYKGYIEYRLDHSY